jgi:PAS domain S-box-containing protein
VTKDTATRQGLSEEALNRLAGPILAAAESAELGVSVSLIEAGATRRVYVSEAAARVLGYPLDELIGMSTFATFAPEELVRMLELHEQWRNGQAIPFLLESVAVRKDGTRVPIEVAYTEIEIDGNSGTVAFIRDISARKRTEDALRQSESLFRKLIEAAPEAVVVTRASRIIYVNPRYLQVLGYDRFEELAGMDPTDLVHPDDRYGLSERHNLILGSSSPAPPRDYRLVRRDRTAVSVECSSLAIDFEGAPAVLTFMRDVTERKETQARLIQTDRMATIGTLAAAVAHELNNPLAYVLLNLGLLERDLDDLIGDQEGRDRVGARLRTVQEGAERMATIVRDLRSFCRPNSPALEPVNVKDVLESAINMAMNELRDRARVVRDYAPAPPILADAARLGQVFLNLLLNAAQALPDGNASQNEVRIVLGSSEGLVWVEVADTGHGIPPESLERIFEPFYTTKLPGVGTGLGLSICHSIVTGLQGKLTVESEVGRGSRFRVTLPFFEASEPDPQPSAVPAPERVPVGARVLIVDDEPAIGVALRKVLERSHHVTSITSGEGALQLLLDGAPFDVILCDVLMPGVSGMDLYRELEEKRPELARRIVFMSGAAAMPRVAEFLEGIDNARIDKPVDLALLHQLIGDVASRKD